MNIILFGPPGSGKGTQADNLVKDFNLFKISAGDILRNEINQNTQIGIKIKTIIAQGSFVADNIINDLIKKIVSNKDYFNRLIFDGYPRNLHQVEYLDDLLKKNKQEVSCVISLKVDKDTIVKRILGRQICTKCGKIFNEFFNQANEQNHSCGKDFLQKRSDDSKITINKRYETYEAQTLPILNYYQSKKILREIDGIGDILTIYKEIRQIMTSFGT